jgi:hypothetical protein
MNEGVASLDTGRTPTGSCMDYGEDENTKRTVNEYDPEREFVVVLLKSEERTSTYRVQAVQRVERGRPRRGRGKALDWEPVT